MAPTAAFCPLVLLPGARASRWAPNTFRATLLCFSYVKNRGTYYNHENCYNNEICHTKKPFYQSNLYSTSIFLLLCWINHTMIATKTATAISPGTNPAPSLPSVIRVPIWYTRNATVYPVAN